MSDAHRPRTIDEYAVLQVALMRGNREDVLRTHGIDEDELTRIDGEFEEALSRAMEEEGDGVPDLLNAYSEALRKARSSAAATDPVLSIEEFAILTRALESGKDVTQVFDGRGITFEKYLRASEHWTPLLSTDADLGQRFLKARR